MRVHFQVIEGSRRRVQVFEGIVIKRQGAGARETFTVRKHSFGVGVERTFPLHSPKIEKIDVAAIGDVNRAKLYYLRGKVGKKARVREMRYGAGAGARGSVRRAARGVERAGASPRPSSEPPRPRPRRAGEAPWPARPSPSRPSSAALRRLPSQRRAPAEARAILGR